MLEIGPRFGDFTVVALIGRGAMGEVYRISDGEAETLSEAVGDHNHEIDLDRFMARRRS
jgi:hypothetical protein